MSAIHAKSRIVTFRASPEEYDALAKACLASGARSISAFSRTAVLERVEMAARRPINISGDLTTLAKALHEVDAVLRDASGKIRRLLGYADGNGNGKSAEGY
jgi:hypothetical protein